MSDSDSDCSTLTELSSGLSSAPTSPELPPFCISSYVTPDSSQTQSTYSSCSEQDGRKRRRNGEACPPAKKRKVTGPKERTTEYIDLRLPYSTPTSQQSAQVDALLKVLRKRRKIVVVAGAGISTSAGVPDFRSSNGLFNTLRADNKLKASGKQLFDASVYQNDASTSSFHQMVRTLAKLTDGAQATPFHHLLATLAEEGRLLRLYTQNVDGIDVDMEPLRTTIPLPKKGPWPKTIQLHGSLKKMVCAKCRELKDFDPELFEGPNPPSCTSCMDLDKIRTEEAGKRSHGIGKLRPRMVLYNEENPDAEAIGATVAADLRTRPDAIIVVGTSMEIPGVQRIVREMCGVIRDRRDGKCVWINRGPPPTGPKFENCWDLVIAGDCDRVAEIADMRKWYEEPREGVRVTDSDAEQAKAKERDVKVIVKSPVKGAKSTPPCLLTPAPSPKLKPTKLKPTKLKLNINPTKTSNNNVNASSKSKSNSKKTTKSLTNFASGTSIKTKPKASTKGKITASFKTSKLQVCPRAKTQKSGDQPKPLEPLSPQSAKNNSGESPPARAATSMLKIEVPLEKPSQAGRLTSMRDETVSPTGRGPRAMADGAAILN